MSGIARSRHQLSTLLRDAFENREALEEQIAQGKRNRKEAGNKYGKQQRFFPRRYQLNNIGRLSKVSESRGPSHLVKASLIIPSIMLLSFWHQTWTTS